MAPVGKNLKESTPLKQEKAEGDNLAQLDVTSPDNSLIVCTHSVKPFMCEGY